MVHVMIRQIVNFGVGGQHLSALIDIDPHDERVWLGGSVKRGAWSTVAQIPLVMKRRADHSLRRRAAFGRFLELHQNLSSRVTSVWTLAISLTRSR